MDLQLKTLLQQKLEAIAREEDARLMPGVDAQWKKVDLSPNCIWLGDLMDNVQLLCHQSILSRGERLADTLTETLLKVKPPYEEDLAAELKAIVDPLLPEDLYLAVSINCRGVYERHGNRAKFNDGLYDHQVTLARVGIANMAREAKLKAHIAIDEYALSMRNERPQGRAGRLWDSINLRPGLFGIGIDLKKFFSRKKLPARD